MHEALERAALRFGDRDCRPERRPAVVVPGSRRSEQCLRPPPGGPRGGPRRPGGPDDGQPHGVHRRRPCHQQDRGGRRPAQPGVEGDRGRTRPRADRTGPRRGRRRRGVPARRVAGSGTGDRSRRPVGRTRSTAAVPRWRAAGVGSGRRGGPRLQLGDHGPPEGRPAHPRVDRSGHGPLVHGPRPRGGRPVPGGHPPLAHPRPAQSAGRRLVRGDRAAAHAVRPRRGPAPHRQRADDPRDGGGTRSPWPWPTTPTSRPTISPRSATSCGARPR